MKKQLIIAGIASVVSVAGLGGIGIANAATDSATGTNTMSSLVDDIATKFKLNKSDVQAVFDSHKDAVDTKRETNFKDKLATLVKDGKLTQAQSDAIQAKRDALIKAHDANKDTKKSESEAERKAAREAEKTDIDNWAKLNNIPSEYVHLVRDGAGHRY